MAVVGRADVGAGGLTLAASLFKYMDSRFASRMLASGEIRLGTLYAFRDEERLGPVIGDRDEGAVHLKESGFTAVDTGAPDSIPPFLRTGIFTSAQSRLQIIARDGIGRRFEGPDCWIYCTSDHFDRQQMLDFGYDACIEIFDVEGFFFAISRKVRSRVDSFWGAAKCVYRSRSTEHTEYDGVPPALIKDPRYAGQAEVRAIWLPKRGEVVRPITVHAKKALRYCRLL